MLDGPLFRDPFHEFLAEEPLPFSQLLEIGMHLHQALVVQNIPLEGHGKERLDATGGACHDADGPCRRDGCHSGVSHGRASGHIKDTASVGGKCTSFTGEFLGCLHPLLVYEPHDLFRQSHSLLRVVRDSEPEQHIGPPHDAKPYFTVFLGHFLDLVEGITVHLNDVIEEPHRVSGDLPQLVVVYGDPVAFIPKYTGQVDGTQIAGFIGKQRLLAAIVNVKPVGVEGVDTRHLDIVHLFHSLRDNRIDGCEEPFPVHSPFEGTDKGPEPCPLDVIVEPDPFLEKGHVLTADNELVLGFSRIFSDRTTTVGEERFPGRPSFTINDADDTQAQQHALDRLEELGIALGETDADALFQVSLDRTVGVEKPTQEPLVEDGGALLQFGGDHLASRLQTQIQGEVADGGQTHAIFPPPGDFLPTSEVRPVRQGSSGLQGGGHDTGRSGGRQGIIVHGAGRTPDGNHGLVHLKRAVTDEKP